MAIHATSLTDIGIGQPRTMVSGGPLKARFNPLHDCWTHGHRDVLGHKPGYGALTGSGTVTECQCRQHVISSCWIRWPDQC